MKQRWSQLAARIDALSQRERLLVFAAVLAVLAFLGQAVLLAPLQRKQDLLKNQISLQRASLAETESAIERKVADAEADPDQALRTRLSAARADTERMSEQMRAMQNGLVPPERMAPLVDSILRANGRLQMVSMRTLATEPLMGAGAAAGAAPQPAAMTLPAAAATPLLYRHGVEVTVRGNYLDMIGYMAALESMPTQLFWGRAQLEAETWPSSRLTLTLYTLSLDAKWMKL